MTMEATNLDNLLLVVILILIAFALAFIATYQQVKKLKECGSDHSVHLFLIDKIRNNGHRLFSTVPGILNEAYLGAFPLFVHYLLSFLKPDAVEKASLILNPLINAFLVVLMCLSYYFLVDKVANEDLFVVGIFVAFCPQFYHAFSARNFGISSRPLGILLISALVITNYLYQYYDEQFIFLVAGVFFCYLIWGSNTFSQQTFVLSGILMGSIYSDWFILMCAFISVLIFILIHKKYALSYLFRTGLFIYTYATQIAKIYILKQRYSIWRDLVYDIYVKLKNEPATKSIQYAYNNSILIVLFLNPFIIISILPFNFIEEPFLVHCQNFSICCFVLFIMTSFRCTRFLGEPERYVEMASSFSILVTVGLLSVIDFNIYTAVLVAYCLLLYFLQMFVVGKLKDYVGRKKNTLQKVEEIINLSSKEKCEQVRFYSNSEDVTKMFMNNDWGFARFWSPDTKFAGYNFQSAYYQFPFYTKELSNDVLEQYKINYVVYDKNNFIDEPRNQRLNVAEKIFEDGDYLTYRLEWS